jgi:hypothetical protein
MSSTELSRNDESYEVQREVCLVGVTFAGIKKNMLGCVMTVPAPYPLMQVLPACFMVGSELARNSRGGQGHGQMMGLAIPSLIM